MKTWRERIAAAQLTGKFTHYDRAAAGQWLTCAVGERFHTKYAAMCPSRIIEKLGYLFEEAVRNNEVRQAGVILLSIEAIEKTEVKEC